MVLIHYPRKPLVVKILFVFVLVAVLLITGCTSINRGNGSGNVTGGGPLRITTAELPAWEAPGSATYKLEVAGGVPPYSFSISGQLPEGFNLGPDGTIGGLVRLPEGTSRTVSPPFTVVVRDSAGNVTQATYTIVIVENADLRILIGLPVTCFVNVRCDEPLADAQGGTEPYHYQSDSFAEGAPPMGTIVDVNGHLVGTPSRAGEYTVGICVVDDKGHSKCDHASVTVERSVNVTGTWVGEYGETETSDWCISANEGTFTFDIRADGDSFTGSVDETGAVTSSTPTANGEGYSCGGGEYHYTGTITGTVAGDTLSGTITVSDAEVSYESGFTATITETTMTGSYDGTGTFDGGSSRVSGSFDLTKQ